MVSALVFQTGDASSSLATCSLYKLSSQPRQRGKAASLKDFGDVKYSSIS